MIDTNLIPKPNNKRKVTVKNGNTQDIINSILKLDRSYKSKKFDKFARQFKGKNGLKRLWTFVKYQIKYKKDSFDTSLQLTPPALWKRRYGDCKSKTLFINAVLRTLGIPYIIRFTNYKKGEKNIKHVYTVAIINGVEIPVDTVYNVFGKEKKYNKKIDYPMTEIVEISGFGQKSSGSTFVVPKQQLIKPLASALKKLEESKQRQKYVTEQPEVRFSKISEGNAILQLAERELSLIGTMQPLKKEDADIGIDLIRKALKGDFSASGQRIPESLAGTISKIKTAEQWNRIPANNFGFMESQLSKLKVRKQKEIRKASIGALDFPSRNCLQNGMWYGTEIETLTTESCNSAGTKCTVKPSFNYRPNDNIQKSWRHDGGGWVDAGSGSGWGGICRSNMHQHQSWEYPMSTGATQFYINDAKTKLSNFGDFTFFHYGRESKYRQSYNDCFVNVNKEFQKLIDDGVFTGHKWDAWSHHDMQHNQTFGRYSVQINSKLDYEAGMERLNASCGVLDAYIQDIFRADSSVQGTMGSGLIYAFLPSTGNPINGFPVSTLTKMGFQDQFIDSAQFFSNCSRSSILAMARNGVLYDNIGEQPEKTLKYLLSLYDGTNSQANIGCFGACTSIALAIIAAVVTITTAIISAVAQGQEAQKQADNIDSYSKDEAQFQPLTQSKMLNENDWLPDVFKGEEGKKNIALVLGAVGLGAYAMLDKTKK